jgi:hypothetical protein
MGEKGNLPGGNAAASDWSKVGHPTAAKDPAAPMAAKDPAAPTAAKDPAVPTAAKALGVPPPPPAGSAPPPQGLPGMGGFVAGREARRDDDPPVAGA